MRFRTVLIIVATLGLSFFCLSVFFANGDVLRQELKLWGATAVPVLTVILGAFLSGLVLASIVGFTREAGMVLERWRLRKATKKSDEIEEQYSRGLVAVLEGREDEALGNFRAVMERDSRHFNTLIKLGEVLRGQGKYSEAIEYHRKAHHIKNDDTRPLYALIEDHEAQGDTERALAVLGKIISINKNSVAAWRKLRSIHVNQKDWERAFEDHSKVEKRAKRGSVGATADRRIGLGIRYEMAKLKLEQNKTKEAIAALRRLIKVDPGFIPAHALLGQALHQAGHDNDAIGSWFRGFEVTGSPIFLTTLEDYYLAAEQPLAAIEALKQCITQARKDTLPRFYLGKLYFRLEMLDDALAVLSSLEGRGSYAPTLHYLLGRIHERRNHHVAAVRSYRKVIREMELVHLDYLCRACAATHVEWSDRCPSCEEWNTIEVNFREEIPLEELGIAPAPIYTERP